ncbi:MULTISPECIES: hypothetical protein [Streptomyces]|uniref:Uncharacterized protein n=1 Tax=Streptomyces luteosporeus TaxID=173856 RepID=A0ABN3U923_9ACTN
MPDMDEIIRRIRLDMNTELRKRARRAQDAPSGWAVRGESGEVRGQLPPHDPVTAGPDRQQADRPPGRGRA